MIELPLFPLNTVLFPGGKLSLRIFEPRYLSMTSRCLQRNEGFGVVLIKEGSEVGTAETFEIGTVAEKFQPATALLRTILAELDGHYRDIGEAYDDASWVGYRVAEILPLPVITKQDMLEMPDPQGRLEQLEPHVESHYPRQADPRDI